MLLERASSRHLAACASENKAKETIRNYGTIEKRFIAWLTETLERPPTLEDLTVANVREHLRWLSSEHESPRWGGTSVGHSAANIRYNVVILKVWAKWLAEEYETDLPNGSPLTRLRIPKAPRKVVQPLSRQQIELLIELAAPKADDHGVNLVRALRNQALITFMVESGLRIAEVCSLKEADITLPDNRTGTPGHGKVLGKGRKERIFGFGRRSGKLIQRYLLRRNDGQPWLFALDNGEQLTRRTVDAMLKRLAEKANITGIRISPHVLRHTHGLLSAKRGVSALRLKEQMGHANLAATQGYVHMAQTDVLDGYSSPLDD